MRDVTGMTGVMAAFNQGPFRFGGPWSMIAPDVER